AYLSSLTLLGFPSHHASLARRSSVLFFLHAVAGDISPAPHTTLQNALFHQERNSLTQRHTAHLVLICQIPFTRQTLPNLPKAIVNLFLNRIVNSYVRWNHTALPS